MKSRKNGFTLIEVIIVISLVGLMLVYAVPTVLNGLRDSRETNAEANVKTLNEAAARARLKELVGPGTYGNDKYSALGWYKEQNLLTNPDKINLVLVGFDYGNWNNRYLAQKRLEAFLAGDTNAFADLSTQDIIGLLQITDDALIRAQIGQALTDKQGIATKEITGFNLKNSAEIEAYLESEEDLQWWTGSYISKFTDFSPEQINSLVTKLASGDPRVQNISFYDVQWDLTPEQINSLANSGQSKALDLLRNQNLSEANIESIMENFSPDDIGSLISSNPNIELNPSQIQELITTLPPYFVGVVGTQKNITDAQVSYFLTDPSQSLQDRANFAGHYVQNKNISQAGFDQLFNYGSTQYPYTLNMLGYNNSLTPAQVNSLYNHALSVPNSQAISIISNSNLTPAQREPFINKANASRYGPEASHIGTAIRNGVLTPTEIETILQNAIANPNNTGHITDALGENGVLNPTQINQFAAAALTANGGDNSSIHSLAGNKDLNSATIDQIISLSNSNPTSWNFTNLGSNPSLSQQQKETLWQNAYNNSTSRTGGNLGSIEVPDNIFSNALAAMSAPGFDGSYGYSITNNKKLTPSQIDQLTQAAINNPDNNMLAASLYRSSANEQTTSSNYSTQLTNAILSNPTSRLANAAGYAESLTRADVDRLLDYATANPTSNITYSFAAAGEEARLGHLTPTQLARIQNISIDY